ncbi:BMQ_0737 family morphogenetic spore coat protein [Brevibacillus gelatini]|uniref:Uncharacterized protein n=1 Tax=Brevibacillus gelatini TaxID=1655277 RepID=A0A3M8AKR9_9BACL|nr:hypothetical protein [Brevibacillus gelatini]RNB51723.1 hypothetical protein EDM57_22145 [Brevibacillus gelatini]
MKHPVKPIMGRQLPTPTPTATPPTPNNLQEECIRVQKVYDWVVLANSYRNKIALPDDCRALVDAAIRAGQDITISCVEPVSPGPTCNVVSIRRENITVNGTTVRVGVVRFVFSATVIVRVFADGTPLCEFTTTVQFDQEVVLCLPEPLNEDNIVCRISALECSPTGNVLLGGMVQLDVIVCVEIQVEAEVKLEVLAKFCSPRPNNIPVPSPTPSFRCPPISFPPQCPPIFPVRNCDCQASVNALIPNISISIGIPLEVAVGTIQLIADICPSCDPSSSSFTFNFFDTVITELLGDQSFSFSPTSISSPTCITVLPGIELLSGLVVTGTGVRTFTATGVQEVMTYSLTLAETGLGLPDVIIFTLTDSNGVLVFTANITVVPDEQLLVRDCITFQDIVITSP